MFRLLVCVFLETPLAGCTVVGDVVVGLAFDESPGRELVDNSVCFVIVFFRDDEVAGKVRLVAFVVDGIAEILEKLF